MIQNIAGKKVGVFLVGSRKCGTTSLANLLASHKDISLSKDKEPNYFNNTISKDLESYHTLFDWSKKIQIEASTSYTSDLKKSRSINEEIKKYNPSAKIIYIVRNPLERIKSHYRMSYERGDLHAPLDDALLSHQLLIDCSKYYSHIKNYITSWGRDNILIINNEELNSSLTEKSLIKFLNLDVPFSKNIGMDNTASTDLRMPKSIDRFLNSKITYFAKSLLPKSVIAKLKSLYYYRRNKNMTMDLNSNSRKLIKKELLTDLERLETIVDFNITHWIQNIKNL